MSSRTVSLAFVAVLAAASFGQKLPVTLDSLKEARTLPPISWAPDGRRFTFVENGSVRLYDVASKTARELVSLAALKSAATPVPEAPRFDWQNRRVTEEAVQWFPDGRSLLISEGGDLFRFRLDAGGWNRITATPVAERDPKLSPDGSRVSYRIAHDLYVLDLASGKVTRLTHDGSEARRNAELDWVYPEELDLGTAHWWSPDSRQVAYLQFDVSREPVHPHADLLPWRAVYEPQRYPKAGDPNADVRLGVVSPDGRETRWLDVGETRDRLLARVHWSPDSAAIFVQQLNRVQNRLDLLSIDVKTGARRLVLREEDPYWINVGDDFRFLRNGIEFLWPSERNGFRHLYRYTAEGKLLSRLTSGDWEVTGVAGVDEKGGSVYFTATDPSPLERHLWRVGFDSAGRTRLSRQSGTHAVTMAPDCAYYIDDVSSLASPVNRSVRAADGSEWAAVAEPDRKLLEKYDFLPSEFVEVRAADGALLYARLTRPRGFAPGKQYPAIVRVYGGPHSQLVTNSWIGLRWEQVMAQRGFVIWELDNRGSSGRGHQWESKLFRRLGRTELEDQQAGVRRLVSMGFVDPARIGVHGWSYGGYMTLYSLLQAPDLFRAGIAGAPLADWRHYDTIYTERYLGLPSENADGYRDSSPIHRVAELRAALLLIHNFEDDNCLFQNTIQIADALQLAGKQFELMLYPQKTHGVSGGAQDHMRELMASFFEKHLK